MSAALADDFWETLPLGRDVTLLAHDANGLAAFNKPAGILSHPNSARDAVRSLLRADYHLEKGEYYEWPAIADAAVAGTAVGLPEAADLPAAEPGAAAGPPIENHFEADGRQSAKSKIENAAAAPRPRRLWLLNRLDAGTSGVILAAASAKLADVIRDHFKRRAVHKTYQALVFGRPPQPEADWRDQLSVTKDGTKIRTFTGGNIPAEARMTFLRHHQAAFSVSLLQLEPRTGRSHQLRVQCAHRSLPIVGDTFYGDFKRNRAYTQATGHRRLFLHSLGTSFDYEWRGATHHFEATSPLPEEFEAALGG